MTITNASVAVRNHLLTYADLTALVGTRIWEGEQPVKGYTPAAGPAVTFQLVGGILDDNDAVQLPILVVDAWAETPLESQTVYLQVFAALDNQSSAYLQHGIIETLGETTRHPDTGWPFTTSSYRVWVVKE